MKHVAIKVIASYTEDQIITSDPSQILAIKKAKQELAIANDVAAPAAMQKSAADFLKEVAMKESSGIAQQAATESLTTTDNPLPPPPKQSAEEIIQQGHQLVSIGATRVPEDPLPPPPTAVASAAQVPPVLNPDRPAL